MSTKENDIIAEHILEKWVDEVTQVHGNYELAVVEFCRAFNNWFDAVKDLPDADPDREYDASVEETK